MVQHKVLYVVRSEIVRTLNIDVCVRGRGQLDFDASMITNNDKRGRSSYVDEVTEERIYPELVHATATRVSGGSRCPLSDDAFYLTRVTRAVNQLPENLNALALYAYSDDCHWDHVETVSCDLWNRFLSSQVKSFRAKKLKTLQGMVLLAMQNWKHTLQASADLHKPARIRELLGINENQWRRDWLPYWRQMHQLLSETDNQVLLNVYRATGTYGSATPANSKEDAVA